MTPRRIEIICPNCSGSGEDPLYFRECPECLGYGSWEEVTRDPLTDKVEEELRFTMELLGDAAVARRRSAALRAEPISVGSAVPAAAAIARKVA